MYVCMYVCMYAHRLPGVVKVGTHAIDRQGDQIGLNFANLLGKSCPKYKLARDKIIFLYIYCLILNLATSMRKVKQLCRTSNQVTLLTDNEKGYRMMMMSIVKATNKEIINFLQQQKRILSRR
jgi:hypothetical protein